MKAGNFTGISGFPNQDVAMWVTMGPIADRTRERLGASDLAIVEFRKRCSMRCARSRGPNGQRGRIGDSASSNRAENDRWRMFDAAPVRVSGHVPKTTDWRTLTRARRRHGTDTGAPSLTRWSRFVSCPIRNDQISMQRGP